MNLEKMKIENQKKFLSDVYQILVKLAAAPTRMYRYSDNNICDIEEKSFVDSHLTNRDYPCTEYRFGGALGFGGKYWIGNNRITCYREDLTPKREKIIDKTNCELLKIAEKYLSK